MKTQALAAAGIAALLLWLGAGMPIAAAQEGKNGALELEWDISTRNISWADQDGEGGYRVEGSVVYLPAPSCGLGRLSGSQVVEFSELLSANTTTFRYPAPDDDRLTWTKDIEVTIEAVDSNGEVLASDGFAMQADKFCTPEEIAAAGTGFDDPARRWAPLAAAMSFGVGVALLAASAAMRRRA